jgi:Cof subfamily protein (haloacid dehalogenase superfamily)
MEMAGNYKGLFVTDLDGTLLNEKKELSQKDQNTLRTLQLDGYATAIATGRSKYSFCRLMESLNLCGAGSPLAIDYVIFSTGAGVMDYPGENLLESVSLPASEVERVARYLDEKRYDYMIHRPVPDTHRFFYRQYSAENPDFTKRLTIYSDFATPLSVGENADFGEATEVLCIVPESDATTAANIIRDAFPQCSIILATSPLDGRSGWIEIFAKSVSKSRAIERLCHHLKVSQKNTCAVGNDYNDEDLLQWAAKGYLVDNGPPQLKKLFPVVASNNDGGVSEAAFRWLR